MSNCMLRTRKDGGVSMCRASDENVGKRRCCHILDGATFKVRQEKGMKFVDIEGNLNGEGVSFSVETSDNNIKTYENRVNDEINNLKKVIINNNITLRINKINTKMKSLESKINNSFIIKKNSGELKQNNIPNRVDKKMVMRNSNIALNNIKIFDKSGNISNNPLLYYFI